MGSQQDAGGTGGMFQGAGIDKSTSGQLGGLNSNPLFGGAQIGSGA